MQMIAKREAIKGQTNISFYNGLISNSVSISTLQAHA